MAYELSGSIEAGNVSAEFVAARANTLTRGGAISPDGTTIAVHTYRHGGATTTDVGIDIWQSGSSGWTEVDSIDTTNPHHQLMWLNNSEFVGLTNNTFYSFKSGSSGWAEDYSLSVVYPYVVMWPNADKSKIAISTQVYDPYLDNLFSANSYDPNLGVLISGSSGYSLEANYAIDLNNVGPMQAVTWVDDDNFIVGYAGRSSGIGRITHYRSNGDTTWSEVAFLDGQNAEGRRNFGNFLYYHTGSETLMVGGAGQTGGADVAYRGYINLFPSASTGLFPTSWSSIGSWSGYEKLDLDSYGLFTTQSNTSNNPYWLDGITLNVDPNNGDRFVVASGIYASSMMNRAFITVETGSSGWKFNQLNPEGNGRGAGRATTYGWGPSQLSADATRYVTWLTGSSAIQTYGFTVYDTGLVVGPALSLSPSSITLSESGTTANVVATLDQDPGANTVDVNVSGLDSTEVAVDQTIQTLTTSNWNTGVTFVFTGQDDPIDDGDQTFNVTFSTTCSGDASFDGLTGTLSVTVEDNDTAGFTLGTGSLTLVEGQSDTISVVLDAQPVSDVVITASLASSFDGRATISPSQLTFTNLNWNTSSNVAITATADRIDNGDVTDNITFSIVTADSSDEYDSVASQTVSLTVEDDDTAGFTINPSSPMEITEGSSDTISVVLDSQPTSDVVIDVSAAADWNSRASLSPASLTFSTSDWETPQDVTITTVHDNQVNGDETDTVTFAVNDSSTSDSNFQALSDQTISVTVKDNDTAAFILTPGSVISVTEAGASSTLSVRLASAPTQNVTASLSGLDTTEVSVSPSSAELTFTSSDWNVAQEFVFTGVDDDIADGNQSFTVTLTAASGDSNFNGVTTSITITNVDDDVDTPAAPKESSTPTGTTIRTGTTEVAKTAADHLPRKIHFEPSTIETIDRSVLSYLTKLNLFADTNEGWKKVPIIWGTAERAYQVKHNKDLRDQQGMLKLPLISIKRVSLAKDMPSKGVFQGTSPANKDEQGGSLAVGRMIYQDKTTRFANADAARLHSQNNYPRYNSKIVYRTVSAPMPVNVTVMYEITIRTEYQQQMNNLMLPFITTPGTINYVRLFDGEHRYEAFIQGDMQNSDNLADFSSDERKFETKIQLKVIGYLIGEENNREKPHYAVRENAVEVKIPRERISLAEVPEMEYGRYYGLEGIPPEQLKEPSPFFTRTRKDPTLPFFFSNVPAVGAGLAEDIVAGGSSGGGNGGVAPGSSLVTTGNFSENLADNMVIRELLKADGASPPSPANQVSAAQTVRANTETVFVNGLLMAVGSGNDYTISGNTITFTFDLTEEDSVYITYIKG